MSRRHILKHLMLKNLILARTVIFAAKKPLNRWQLNTENSSVLSQQKLRIERFGLFFILDVKGKSSYHKTRFYIMNIYSALKHIALCFYYCLSL